MAVALIAALALTTLPVPVVRAAIIPVPCDPVALVAAINAANADPDPDTLELAAGCTYTLTQVDNTPAEGPNGLPVITTAITIHGHGATIARDATAPAFRLFQVAGAGDLALDLLSVRGGHAPNGGGGTTGDGNNGIPGGPGGPGGSGGGIYLAGGALTLTNATLGGNTAGTGGAGGNGAFGGPGGPGGSGGGIYLAGGALTLTNATLGGNTAGTGGAGGAGHRTGNLGTPGNGGAGGSGGGIYLAGGLLAATNTTLSGNAAGTGGAGFGDGNLFVGGNGGAGGGGGGIYLAGGTLTLTNATLGGNAAAGGGTGGRGYLVDGTPGAGGGGGAIFNANATTLTLRNTLLAGNAPANCAGTVTDGGFNLQFPDATCDSIPVNDPQLGPLADNGGPTQTRRPALTSPAIDLVPSAGANCPATDQRGVPRPQRAACDSGAVEVSAPPTITAVAPSSGPASGGTTLTITGTNFYPGTTVTVGGQPCGGVTIGSSTTLTCTTAAHAPGAVDVVVTFDAQAATAAGAFTYIPPPTLSGVTPAGGPTSGGTTLTLSGTDFQDGATVLVGNTPCANVLVQSATSITCNAPAHAAGVVDVVVTNPDGQADTLPGAFTYIPPPTVASLTPAVTTAGGPSVALTIAGSGFVDSATVDFGGQVLMPTSVRGTSITVTVPASALRAAGNIPVRVVNPGPDGGPSSALTFVVNPAGASQLAANGGDGQSTAITTTFGTPLSITVRDPYGNLVGAGTTVTFTAPTSGASGTFSGGTTTATAMTDASSVATAPDFTANQTVGSYTVVASAGGGAVPFTLSNTPGPTARLVVTSTATAVAGSAVSITVTVLDAGGNPVPGYTGTVHFTSSDNTAILPGDYTFTGADAGTHTFSVTLKKAGSQTITVTDKANAALTATATVNVAATGAASVAASGGTPQSAQVSTVFVAPLVAVVRDASGNPLAGISVTFTTPATGASATFGGGHSATAVTDANGAATAPVLTANDTAGAYTATTTVAGVAGSATFTLTNTAAPIPLVSVTVTTTGTGSVTPGTGDYPLGTTVSFTASTTSSNIFLGWTVDGQFVGFGNPLALPVTKARTVVAAFAPRPTFSDVPSSDPDYQAVSLLAALGIINPSGVNGTGMFLPAQDVKRTEMAAFIARIFNWQREFHRNNFPDKCDPAGVGGCVDDELWNDVAALADYGVVGGYPDQATCDTGGTVAPCYLPRDPVKRIQVLSIVARAFPKTPDLRPTGFWDRLPANLSQYTNVPNTGTQRSDLTTYRTNAGPIPEQTSDSTFPNPDGNASRRFVVEALYQAYAAQFGVNRLP